MFHDPKFWLAVSFIAFVLLLIKYALPVILKVIDSKVGQVSASLKDAEEMKESARKLLVDAQKYHEDSIKYSDQLIKDALSESEKIIKDYEVSIKNEVDKKIAASNERIKSEEERVVRDIKSKIVESAIMAIEDNIGKVVDDKSLDEVTKSSISQISSKLVN